MHPGAHDLQAGPAVKDGADLGCLAQTDMPTETRDYIFKIFSAAVIGEDPKLFGFEFDRPLANTTSVREGT